MNLRHVVSVFVMSALLFGMTTPALQAANVSSPGAIHVVMPAQLHQAVQDSDKKVNDARDCIQSYIERPEVTAQLQHYGVTVAEVKARVATLSEEELLFVQRQIMTEDLQKEMVGGLTKGGKIMIIIGLAVAAVGVVMIATGGQSQVGSSDVAIDWRTTGYVWAGAGAILTIIGLTRRQ